MPRKPVDQLAAAATPSGRQHIWDAMRAIVAARLPLTTTEIIRRTHISPGTVQSYIQALAAARVLAEDAPADQVGVCIIYRLLIDQAEAPRINRCGAVVLQGRAQEQMWQTMRRLDGMFTADELALFASTDQVTVTAAHAVDYCRRLARAGYLRRKDGKKARYVFRRAADTGPLSPMVQITKAVWDQNLSRIVWPVGEALP